MISSFLAFSTILELCAELINLNC